jgi:hypothetical protein
MFDAAINSSFARLQQAQMAQLSSLAAVRTAEVMTMPMGPSGGAGPVDTVSLGQNSGAGLMPNPQEMRRLLNADLPTQPLSSDPNFWEKQNAYYDELFKKIAVLKAMEAAAGIKSGGGDTSASKGDLNVVAGNRKDGVKAKKVTIHEHRNWSTRQYDENVGGYREHESKFENAKVGGTYQVNVEWEDGTTTTRNVTMDSPGQTVYIDTQY